MFISTLNKGGAERVLVNLAEYFYKKGYWVTIVTQYRAEDEYEISPGISRIFSEITKEEIGKSRILNFCRRFAKLRGIWKQEKPDLILSFIGKNNMMTILTSRFLKIPVVVSVRGEPREEYYSKSLRAAAKWLFRLADGIVLQTEGSKEFFPKAVRKKSIVLKNSLSPAFLKERYPGEREKQIVAVGRIDANKNHEMIIRAFAEIADEYPDYGLTIYGEGVLRQPLKELVKELGLSERVSLPGNVRDVANAIYKASVFVLSSYSEGMPNTLIEAMALGLPVISADCSGAGPRDLIIQGENGILIQPGNWKELAENLQKILNNPDLAKKMGENAAKIQRELNPETVNGAWEAYFQKITAGQHKN